MAKNTSATIKGSGENKQTGGAVEFNWSGLADTILTGTTNLVSAIFAGKAMQNGTYYNKYNQGANNAFNSSGTLLLITAGIVAIVALKK